jgi:hypothetical protein
MLISVQYTKVLHEDQRIGKKKVDIGSARDVGSIHLQQGRKRSPDLDLGHTTSKPLLVGGDKLALAPHHKGGRRQGKEYVEALSSREVSDGRFNPTSWHKGPARCLPGT